jgi:replicative DNA helicase
MLYDLELESGVLGALMSDKRAVEEYADQINLDLFYGETNRGIASAIVSLYGNNESIDTITIMHMTKKLGLNISPRDIVDMTLRIASSAHISDHILKLKEFSIKRRLNDIINLAHKKVNDPTVDVFELLGSVESQILNISDEDIKSDAKVLDSIIVDTVKEIEYLSSQDISFLGFSTGFSEFDGIISGYKAGTFNIIAARPAMGKTALMTAIVLNGVRREKYPALIFSLEMQQSEIAYRLIASETEINSELLKKGKVTDEDFEKINYKTSRLLEGNVFIHDEGSCNIQSIRKQGRKICSKFGGISLIAIDYIQLMKGVEKGVNNREQEIASISRGLKMLSKELNCPIIALAQLSRQVENRADKKPLLADLRESGSLEQDADTVSFLYRPEYYGINEFENGDSTLGVAEIVVAKNRHGRTGTARLKFIKEYTKFVDNHTNTDSYFADKYTEPLKPNYNAI